MGVDANILGNSGPGHRIDHDGKTYHISLIDQRAKAEFEERLFRRALSVAKMMADSKPDGWYEEKLAKLDEEFMAGDFALLSDMGLKILLTPGGVQLLLSVLTGLDVVELVSLISAKKSEVMAIIHLVIRESFPGVKIEKLETPDPNLIALPS